MSEQSSRKRSQPATTGISFRAPNLPKKSKSSKPIQKPTKKGIRRTWTGGVEMHAGVNDNTTLLEEELDDVNHALSSDSDDETQKVGKKKFTDDYEDKLDLEAEPTIDKSQGEEETNDKRFIDDQEFTGFNLKDEKEEGKFEDDGNFTWEKDENDHADEWLAKVDWKNIDNMSSEQRKRYKEKFKREHAALEDVEANINSETSLKDVIKAMETIMDMVLPHETVAGALKRLRPKKKINIRKKNKYDFEEKKKEQKIEQTDEEKQIARDLVKLSDAANKVAGTGFYDIYTASLTQLNEFLEKKTAELAPVAVDDDLDLFDNDEPKKSATTWEYKWGEDSTEHFGPFSTEEMIGWKEAGFFENTPEPVFCRRTSTQTFYNISRTDFEIYS